MCMTKWPCESEVDTSDYGHLRISCSVPNSNISVESWKCQEPYFNISLFRNWATLLATFSAVAL